MVEQTPPHHVLVVEDDPATRNHLAAAVSAHSDLRLLGTAETLAEGRSLLTNEVDVLLVDLGLPDGSGIDLIRDAVAGDRDTLVMVVTVFGDEQTVLSAIEAGASGYLLKNASPDDVAAAVLQLVGGGSPISPSIARHLLRRYHKLRDTVPTTPHESVPAPGSPLTSRETEILGLVAKGFSSAEVAGLVALSTHTVTTHVRNIYRKLEVSSRTSAIYEAVNSGWLKLED